jgi:hypothetical protein
VSGPPEDFMRGADGYHRHMAWQASERATAPVRHRHSTHARVKIANAVSRYGMEVESMEWHGREGWLVFVKDYGVASGYSWQEVVRAIDNLAPGWLDGTIIG